MFTLIIIRVGLGYTLNESSGPQGISDRHIRNQELSNGEYQLRPVAINVSVSRTDDRQSLELYDRKEPGDLELGSGSDAVTGTAS